MMFSDNNWVFVTLQWRPSDRYTIESKVDGQKPRSSSQKGRQRLWFAIAAAGLGAAVIIAVIVWPGRTTGQTALPVSGGGSADESRTSAQSSVDSGIASTVQRFGCGYKYASKPPLSAAGLSGRLTRDYPNGRTSSPRYYVELTNISKVVVKDIQPGTETYLLNGSGVIVSQSGEDFDGPAPFTLQPGQSGKVETLAYARACGETPTHLPPPGRYESGMIIAVGASLPVKSYRTELFSGRLQKNGGFDFDGFTPTTTR